MHIFCILLTLCLSSKCIMSQISWLHKSIQKTQSKRLEISKSRKALDEYEALKNGLDKSKLEAKVKMSQIDYKSNAPTTSKMIQTITFSLKNCLKTMTSSIDVSHKIHPIKLKSAVSSPMLTTHKRRTKATNAPVTTTQYIKEYKVKLNGLQELVCGEKYGEDDSQVKWEKINGVSKV